MCFHHPDYEYIGTFQFLFALNPDDVEALYNFFKQMPQQPHQLARLLNIEKGQSSCLGLTTPSPTEKILNSGNSESHTTSMILIRNI